MGKIPPIEKEGKPLTFQNFLQLKRVTCLRCGRECAAQVGLLLQIRCVEGRNETAEICAECVRRYGLRPEVLAP